MDNSNNFNYTQTQQAPEGTMAKAFMANVFSWMFLALTVSSVMAYLFSHSSLINQLFDFEAHRMKPLAYIAIFSPFAFILIMSLGFNKLSYPVLAIIFMAYATMIGISLSTIFLRYDANVIYLTFAISAGLFGTMALLGYTTSTDLTKFGTLMMIGLFGIVIASIVNWFMQSSGLYYLISIGGVVVFTGLTAFDVQKLKQLGSGVTYGSATTAKLSIMGALTLYLDFINLFIFLLRIMGSRR